MKKISLITSVIAILLILSTTIYGAEINESNILVPVALMIETNTNKTLYEKNSNQTMYPASTTKVMTAIVVAEHCNLSDKATVSYNAISTIPEGYETANLSVGEELTIEELLNLMLIKSANDAANVLAEHVSGSIESFVSLMNTKAHELGCSNTHFTNPYGLHDTNHYSSAYDLYLIAKHAMKNDAIKNTVKKKNYILYPTNKNEDERKITNTNKLLDSSSDFYDKRVIGVKTGFTTPAGECLITCATENNIEIIIVTLGGGLTYEEPSNQQYTSTLELINYAFNNYSYKTLNEANSYYDTVTVKNATEETKNLKLLVKDEITVFLNNESTENTPKVELRENISAPIQAGEKLGTITYNILDTEYTSDLIANSNVELSKTTIYIFIISVAILIIISLITISRKKNKKKKRRYY